MTTYETIKIKEFQQLKKCAVECCQKKWHSRGYCADHYAQFRKLNIIKPLERKIKPELLEELKKKYPDSEFLILKCGSAAIVDKDDYEKLKHIRWHYSNRYIKGRNKVNIARIIMDCPKGKVVDHINGNRFDNRKCNLRVTTQCKNNKNAWIRKDNTSGFKGVHWHRDKYECYINVDKKSHYLGASQDPIYLAHIYDIWALYYYGEFAKTNKMMGLL